MSRWVRSRTDPDGISRERRDNRNKQQLTRSAKILADLASCFDYRAVVIVPIGAVSHRKVLLRVVRRNKNPVDHLPAIQRIIPRSLCSTNRMISVISCV
jgi:hypothetical protein